jgi:hypothetical protein
MLEKITCLRLPASAIDGKRLHPEPGRWTDGPDGNDRIQM